MHIKLIQDLNLESLFSKILVLIFTNLIIGFEMFLCEFKNEEGSYLLKRLLDDKSLESFLNLEKEKEILSKLVIIKF